MSDRERFDRAFSPVHASPETLKEVLKMTERTKRAHTVRRSARMTVIIAAIFILLLSGSAYAIGQYVNSPEQAWKVTQQEIQKMKDMGILSQEFTLGDEPANIGESPERNGSDYWFGRIFRHRYFLSSLGGEDGKYFMNLDVDTVSGKITRLSMEAKAGENDVPVAGDAAGTDGEITYCHANYDDIIPADLTVGRLCSLMAEYWGFSGYTISGTKDDFYGYDTEPPAEDMLVSELGDKAYLTVFFEGDQSGVPMYVELASFTDGVYVTIGTNHLVG